MDINIVHTLKHSNDRDFNDKPSIFLAGHTVRQSTNNIDESLSWRPEVIEHLNHLKFNGTVYIPEFSPTRKYNDWTYEKQVLWEIAYLKKCDIILFWIPRKMPDLPGLTTNIEFGEWYTSGKVVMGIPDDADKMQYIKTKCMLNNIPVHNTLEYAVIAAVSKMELWDMI